MTLLTLVQFNNLFRVDRQTLVWVNDNAEQSRVCLQTIYRIEWYRNGIGRFSHSTSQQVYRVSLSITLSVPISQT